MKDGTCEDCEGSGRQRWLADKSMLAIRRGDGKPMGPSGKWVPTEKDEKGEITRECEKCKGSGVDPVYAAKQRALEAATRAASDPLVETDKKVSCEICKKKVYESITHICTHCGKVVCGGCWDGGPCVRC